MILLRFWVQFIITIICSIYSLFYLLFFSVGCRSSDFVWEARNHSFTHSPQQRSLVGQFRCWFPCFSAITHHTVAMASPLAVQTPLTRALLEQTAVEWVTPAVYSRQFTFSRWPPLRSCVCFCSANALPRVIVYLPTHTDRAHSRESFATVFDNDRRWDGGNRPRYWYRCLVALAKFAIPRCPNTKFCVICEQVLEWANEGSTTTRPCILRFMHAHF